ncbi:MAG: acetate--CoA ligase family protein [Deltaproteobacteria bacterium]|nr:acetate--CoA ligase family protein [Deltaproteobacteria bacterium]
MDNKRRKNLEYLFKPRSIAILGASADLNKLSGRPLAYMKRFGYPGNIYPINPKYDEIAGIKCYPSLNDVPGDIDMLMVIVPAKHVLKNLEMGHVKGVKVAVVITGGFSEVGGEGEKAQQGLTDFAKKTGMLIYGPNTNGFISIVNRTVATFSQSVEVIKEMVPGNTGLITQSGAFGATIFDRAMKMGLGMSHWAATGNEADLEFCDFVEYMVDDPQTKVIAGFLAGVEDGQKLVRALHRAAEKGKPVIILKVGGTEASQRAAQSHTGAMVGSAESYDAIFKQKGVIVARDVPDLIDYSMALASLTSFPKGKRVGIMTESGGGGILLTERCAEFDMTVPEVTRATENKLKEVVPAFGSIKNPVDLTGQTLSVPGLIKDATEVMMEVDDFDIVVPFLLMSKATAEIRATGLTDIMRKYKGDKTMMVCWPEGPKEWVKHLVDNGIPVSETASACAELMNSIICYKEFKEKYKNPETIDESVVDMPQDRREKAMNIIHSAKVRGASSLNEYDAKGVLRAYGISTVDEALATSPDEAIKIAGNIGYPVAAKLVSSDILHKTEADVIRLNVESEEQLRSAYEQIIVNGKKYKADARVQGVLVQEMVSVKGIETIIGVSRKEPFGPTMMFGLGGILVEVMKDVSIKVLPVSTVDVENMVSEIRGARILQGVRGSKPSDTGAITNTLLKVACMASELKDTVAELDINPLIAFEEGKGVKAVDALILLRV